MAEPHREPPTYYRVQMEKPWYHRKWQAEWPDCYWAQRGYTRTGIRWMAAARMAHPWVDAGYVRWKILVRRYITQRAWYTARYDWLGRPL